MKSIKRVAETVDFNRILPLAYQISDSGSINSLCQILCHFGEITLGTKLKLKSLCS